MFLINEIQYINIDNDKYLMLNLINGAADYINTKIFTKLLNNDFEGLDNSILNNLKERKYMFENIKEYNRFIEELEGKIEYLEKNSIPNFLIIPSYACNLNCTYCYEKMYDIKHTSISDNKKNINKQFNVIKNIIKDISKNNNNFLNEDIKITIMGGEPLLISQKTTIKHILQKAKLYGYKVNIITNGINITPFISYLKDEVLEYLQITLDGTKDIHDKRRIFSNGKGSFDIIMSNIKELLKNNIKIYLRINVDKENIDNLPELADYIINTFPDLSNFHPYIYIYCRIDDVPENRILLKKVLL